VSSNYRLLCLSHDPAIVIDRDFYLQEIEAVTRDHEALQGHEGCDIIAGRFSYPLIEAGCIGKVGMPDTGCKGYHNGVEWIRSEVLRLLHAAAPSVSEEILRPFVTRCWPLERLRKLRVQLGIEEAAERGGFEVGSQHVKVHPSD
jgi:hypothetical protein